MVINHLGFKSALLLLVFIDIIYSFFTLAWKILWTEEPGRQQSMGLLRVGHNWATSVSLFTFMHWEGNGNPLQCSCLQNPRDGGAWWAAFYGVAQSRTQLKRISSSSSILSLLQFSPFALPSSLSILAAWTWSLHGLSPATEISLQCSWMQFSCKLLLKQKRWRSGKLWNIYNFYVSVLPWQLMLLW